MIINDETMEDSMEESIEEEDNFKVEIEEDAGPSVREAFAGLEPATKSVRVRSHPIYQVERMRDSVARKRMRTSETTSSDRDVQENMFISEKHVRE